MRRPARKPSPFPPPPLPSLSSTRSPSSFPARVCALRRRNLCLLSALVGASAFSAPSTLRASAVRRSGFVSMAAKDIVDTAVGAGSFGTLVAAVTAAGLVDTLKSAGPFTVFAPTDAAFAALPAGTVEDLLKPENKAKLASILTYHVVSGKVMAATAVTLDGKDVATVNGKSFKVTVAGGAVKVDSATVVTTDIDCTNGVIHVIDAVIIPK